MSEQVREPTILVVFGATGDLMARKIVPSLFHLLDEGLLPERFHVVGFSRRDWADDDLRQHVRGILAERHPDALPALVESFLSLFTYQKGTFEDAAAYQALADGDLAIDEDWGVCANKLYYLAVPPENYATIFRNLAASGLTKACGGGEGWTRVLVEKPFGRDSSSSQELDEMLASLFKEEQIYRIDHYLAKEMLQSILAFRFHNDLFESEWDRGAIERIDISLLETVGVEKRGAFYDGVGALRDVGQNHLLQMLALVTMDKPEALDAPSIRSSRARLLASLRPMRPDEVSRDSYRAQYRGYRDLPGVSPDSQTETFFKLRSVMSGERWAGVPVTLESGKRVGAEPQKRIVVLFRHAKPCLCGNIGFHYRNEVVFTLEPNDKITITFWAKKPGFEQEVEKRDFEFFLYEKGDKAPYVEEYAKLLFDAIRGDQTSFVSTEEVRAMWHFIDPVVAAWGDGAAPLDAYEPDSDAVLSGADEALERHKRDRSIAVVGLGKMGAGIARNLLDHDWTVVGFNRHPEVAQAMTSEGLVAADTLRDLVSGLRPPRTIWLMVPAGAAVETTLFGDGATPGLADMLDRGDAVVDGGNSRYTDAARRAARLAEKGIGFLDCGTSGGPAGARKGACIMVGGDIELFDRLEPVFADLAVPDGYRHVGGPGAGHFVKMVHNAIEYGMMQAIAEGFTIMRESPFELDLAAIADVYQHSSVVESRLVGWLRDALARFGPDLERFSGSVGSTGEASWAVEIARASGVETPVIADALRFREDSENDPGYTGRLVQALRNEFGGHGYGAHAEASAPAG